MKKFFLISCVPIFILLIACVLTFAFGLISAPSDTSVFFGFLIMGITFATISLLFTLATRKYRL